MDAIKITKVLDYIEGYCILFGDGRSGMESGVYQSGRSFGCRYFIPMAARHIVQSSLKVQDGVSFFFKRESAWPVPFLPQ